MLKKHPAPDASSRWRLHVRQRGDAPRIRCAVGRFISLILLFAASLCEAASWSENFASDPMARGWRVFGDASLFRWNSTNQNLEVTWDSSRTNSYFYRSLDTILGKEDEFQFSFDLRMAGISGGINPEKPFTFQLALGFLNFGTATRTNFIRGSGTDAGNLVEWNYFPAFLQFAPTIAQVIVSTNGQWFYNHDNLRELTLNDLFHVTMDFRDQTLTTKATRNGLPYGEPQTIVLLGSGVDFRVDTLAVSSYSDVGQEPAYEGSILAHGTVDNIAVVLPPPPITNLTIRCIEGKCQVQFQSSSRWRYALVSTEGFDSWRAVTTPAEGNDGIMILEDASPQRRAVFYRVEAARR
ncbi:MAG: hypothetical protein SGJ20_05980 [Planctomycetota bacterium]|nr:hypothetical protein [Planctomycetota bacterium]